jgi:hypothetical protein
MMNMNISRRLFLGLAVTGLVACATTGRNPRADQPATILEVDNQSNLDMNIYVFRGSERIRIGTATGLAKSHLKIPADLIFGPTALRFLADPIGANRLPISEEITVSPGDTVQMTIPFR